MDLEEINKDSSGWICIFWPLYSSKSLELNYPLPPPHPPFSPSLSLSIYIYIYKIAIAREEQPSSYFPLNSKMSSSNKKHNLKTDSVELGCRQSLAAFFCCKPKHGRHRYNSSSSTTTATFSSPTSPPEPDEIKSLRAVQGFGRLGGASVAVEKDSDEPYHDFRRSMLQMILEKELYTKEDLKQLLNCFLQLNSPYYHPIIVRAFADIWNAADCF